MKTGEKQVEVPAMKAPPSTARQEFLRGDFFVLALVFNVPS